MGETNASLRKVCMGMATMLELWGISIKSLVKLIKKKVGVGQNIPHLLLLFGYLFLKNLIKIQISQIPPVKKINNRSIIKPKVLLFFICYPSCFLWDYFSLEDVQFSRYCLTRVLKYLYQELVLHILYEDEWDC